MIDKITKAFTYVGNYISRRRFLSYVQKCEKTRTLATSYWTQYARIECVWLRIIGLWETSRYLSIIENMKLINLQSLAILFLSALAFNHSHQHTGSLRASSPFGGVARSHSRAARERLRELRRSLSRSLATFFARHSKWRAYSPANSWGLILKTS